MAGLLPERSAVIGTNKRYAASIDAQMNARVPQMAMRDHEPISLTGDELDLENEAITRPPRARPVRAWVRYGATPVHVDAELVAWTATAAAIRWTTPDGVAHRAWVWASAITGR